MTREQSLEWAIKYISRKARKSHPDYDEFVRMTSYVVSRIYDDFEEELKKAYIEGSNDAWKARNESIEKAIVSVEDSYGWMTYEDKQNCIEILYGLRT